MLLPIIIQGAIQQIVWQTARLSAKIAKATIAPAIVANVITEARFCIESPFQVCVRAKLQTNSQLNYPILEP
jgi:hypothetical protein